MGKLEKYLSYKDSAVEWLGQIPKDWEIQKLKFNSKIETGNSISDSKKNSYENIENLSYPYISTKDINYEYSTIDYANGLRIPTTEKNFKVANPDTILICIEGGSAGKKIAFNTQKICYVNKLASIQNQNNTNSKFLYYLTKSHMFKKQFELSMNGLIGGVSISIMKNFELIFPKKEEQTKIASFLDEKIAQIDEVISQKQKLIELLKERKQIVINDAVTEGLDKNVEFVDSGVEWMGEIPKHWKLIPLKYILKERNERSVSGEETLFMMSQIHGLVVRADYHEKAEIAKDNIGNKKVYKNDLVFNKLKAHLGVFYKSNINETGLVSPDYAVYYSNDKIEDLKFLEILFRHPKYIGQFISLATGIVEGLIRLYTDDLFSLKVAVPPKEEQKQIIIHCEEQVSKIDKAIELQQNYISKLKEYKASLIDSVVTGKVRV
jgi:type I restriction enzyme, S subunit